MLQYISFYNVFSTIPVLHFQGPCTGNQLALAHSRLWDAVGGFLYIFAHMQDKLSKDPDQLELLREFMGLQKEMMIMLLSMLEGRGICQTEDIVHILLMYES